MNASDTKNLEATTVRLRKDDCWFTLTFSLAEDYTGDYVVRLAPGVRIALESADELASTCKPSHWLSGIASGAFYAYRTLKTQRRVLVISELTGRLQASGNSGLAYAAARGVALCLHRDPLLNDSEGWEDIDHPPAKPVPPAALAAG